MLQRKDLLLRGLRRNERVLRSLRETELRNLARRLLHRFAGGGIADDTRTALDDEKLAETRNNPALLDRKSVV